MRGRPAVTRARVLTYWAKHGPCTIAQVVRATGAERNYVARVLKLAGVNGEIDVPSEWGNPGRPRNFFSQNEFGCVLLGAIAA